MTVQAVFGIKSSDITDEECSFFLQHQPYGFILFKHNFIKTDKTIKTLDEIANLITNLKNICPNALIFIDQEGGKVQRISENICGINFPSAEFFANLYEQDSQSAIQATYDNYFGIGTILKRIGIDVNCAPVADLRHQGAHDVIGDRSFGSSVKQVVDLCTAAINGLADAGIKSVIKHIPGHGRAMQDSHHELPYVSTPLEELEQSDFEVFKQLIAKNIYHHHTETSTVARKMRGELAEPILDERLDCHAFARNDDNASDDEGVEVLKVYAMTAHVVYESLDPNIPVTLSKNAIQYIKTYLCNTHGNSIILLSDGLEMKAIQNFCNNDKYTEETSAVARKMSGELVESILIGEQKRIPKSDNANGEVSRVLYRAASTALTAGCDILLHCNGNLNEMAQIVEACYAHNMR
jgi:beta-glucosidase